MSAAVSRRPANVPLAYNDHGPYQPSVATPATTEAHKPQLDPTHSKEGKVLHPDLVNPLVKTAQYAVRGELYLKGEELRKQGKQIIFTNVGNPHALGAKPITFLRQVLSLAMAPFMLDHPLIYQFYPPDVVDRVRLFISSVPAGVGSYTDSRGFALVRERVAAFIEKRDGYPANPEHVFLTDGASPAVKTCLNMVIRTEKDGILVPIPQYPLYSAAIAMFGGTLVPYYMDESNDWSLCMESIQTAIEKARSEGIDVRALVFINPGNPTGTCLSTENLQELFELSAREELFVMADEVYQELVYPRNKTFISAKKVLMDMPEPIRSQVELASFHTVSKGTTGECGLRGGYMELVNIHPEGMKEFYKCASVNLCPNTMGQLAVWCMVDPPSPGTFSHQLYHREQTGELSSLKRRAKMVSEGFNSLPGMSACTTEGAMYSFPKIELPPKAIAAAEAAGKKPDVFYCLSLLESAGIATVPGSGFGQEPGTFHFRTSILPQEDVMEEFVDKFKVFHEDFMKKYA